MLLSDFDYQLPKELIAQYPLSERDQARLLILDRGKQSIEHRFFRDIPDYLRQGDLLFLNDTKVLQCRLKGKKKTGGKAEVLLLKDKGNLNFRERADTYSWSFFASSAPRNIWSKWAIYNFRL